MQDAYKKFGRYCFVISSCSHGSFASICIRIDVSVRLRVCVCVCVCVYIDAYKELGRYCSVILLLVVRALLPLSEVRLCPIEDAYKKLGRCVSDVSSCNMLFAGQKRPIRVTK